ncbi:MAG: hypothetical protein IKM54_03325, partial [Butyricicoccus sp.]|nr:hypothetical protein [Butyricicoccus sp.]
APAHGQGVDNSTAYAHYDGLLKRKMDELMRMQAEIEMTIERVDNRAYRELLRGRYLENKTWEQIAVDRNCSYQNVVQFLHPKALDAIGKLLDSI